MVALVRTSALIGVDAHPVEVEAELSTGLPYFSVIGLGGTSVQEARYRIQAALRTVGVEMPHKKITVNLAPAALRKEGTALDLPMALSLLVALGVITAAALESTLSVGELALSGAIRAVRGVLSVAALARSLGFPQVIVPRENGAEATAISGLRVLAPSTLSELLSHLRGEALLSSPIASSPQDDRCAFDLREVRGQRSARRALEIAAAGGHNILFLGNPGSGKTMLARRIPSIMPPLEIDERIEVTRIWSVAGLTLGNSRLIESRPFRSPHPSISEAGLIGGGSSIRPGEVSLAHHGVLFLDEMPELPRRTLESLRQPLEDREVIISRARHTVRLPASFMLVGAANPCPCGWLGHHSRRCGCTEDDVKRYLGRISGPLLDRLDMVVEAPSLTAEELLSEEEAESSSAVRERVTRARVIACDRAGKLNAYLSGPTLRRYARPDEHGQSLLRTSLETLDLSARSVDRMLRVARTIADLRGDPMIGREALAEALRYRPPRTLNTGQLTAK